MDERVWLAERFEAERPRLRGVAYRMLGSLADADDALQEASLRVTRAGAAEVDNMAAWLTTVVARVSLNILRARRSRREEPFDAHVPDPVISSIGSIGSADSTGSPEDQAMLADAVGLALMVVLETLTPAERLAFVLHDMFAVPFEEIAPMLDRTPAATRQLASRGRRRVRAGAPPPDPDLARQRAVVDAYIAAAREGHFDGLVAVLHPDVVLRADGGTARPNVVLRGATTVAGQAVLAARLATLARPALVNGAAGIVALSGDRVMSVMGFTVVSDRIVAMDVLTDPTRLATLTIPAPS